MIRYIKRLYARRALNRKLDEFDRRIAEARARHAPVAHIQGAKQRFLHDALKDGVS